MSNSHLHSVSSVLILACRQWYHLAQCKKITDANSTVLSTIRRSGLELLQTRPSSSTSQSTSKKHSGPSNAPPTPETSDFGSPGPLVPIHELVHAHNNDDDSDEEEAISDEIRTIRRFAESSILRGAEHGIVGNSIPVLEAREVLAYLKHGDRQKDEGERLLSRWYKRHEPMDENEDEDDHKRFICPDCRLVI